MKKFKITLVLFAVLFSFTACNCNSEGESREVALSETQTETDLLQHVYDVQDLEFLSGENITIDAEDNKVYFNDGIISYSWTTDEWSFELYNGCPKLQKVFEGIRLSFFVMEESEGIAEDLMNYALCGIEECYSEDNEHWGSNIFPYTADTLFADKGYIGVQTGYSDLSKFDEEIAGGKNLSIVYSLTDGSNSVVICLSAIGLNENIQRLHSEIFPDGTYVPVLEEAAKEIIESFSFNNSKESVVD